jgi:hypothetical protein
MAMLIGSAFAFLVRLLRPARPLVPLLLVVGAAVVMAYYTRAAKSVIGLPQARPVLLAVAGILLAAAAIGPWRWLSRQLSEPVQPDASASARQRLVFGLALLALAASVSIFGQFDGLRRGLHAPGDSSAGVSAATAVASLPPQRRDRLSDAVAAWSQFVRPRPDGSDLCATRTPSGSADELVAAPLPHDCNAPITVLAWQLGLDTAALVPAYAAVLGLFLVWGRRLVCQHAGTIGGTAGPETAPRIAGIARRIGLALLLAVVADWLENGLTVLLTTDAWTAYNRVGPGDYGSFGLLASTFWSLLLSFTVWAKWALVIIVLGYLLAVGVLLAQHGGSIGRRWGRARGVAQTLLAVRVQLLVVAVLAGLLLLHEQVPDVIRRWVDDDSRAVGVRGVLAVGFLAVTVWLTARWTVANAMPGVPKNPKSARLARRWAVAVVVAAAVAAPWLLGWEPDLALAVPLGIAAVIGALSWLLRDVRLRAPDRQVRVPAGASPRRVVNRWLIQGLGRKPTAGELLRYRYAVQEANPDVVLNDGQLQLPVGTSTLRLPDVSILADRPGLAREVLPRLLGSAVVAILGLAVLRAAVGLTLFNQLLDLEIQRFLILALVGLGLLLLAGVGFWLLDRLGPAQDLDADMEAVRRSPWPPVAWLSVSLLVWWAVIWWMTGAALDEVAQWTGVIGVVGAALLLLTVAACSLAVLPERLRAEPLPLFRVLGLRRTPVLSLLAIWAVVASLLPIDERLHDVRPMLARATTSASAGITLQDAFDQWRRRNCIAVGDRAVGPGKPVVPLVLVASSGGGIRAGAWTSQVLDEVLKAGPVGGGGTVACRPGRPDVRRTPQVNWVFAASGVSGGSLGLAAYAARLTEAAAPEPLRPGSAGVQGAEGSSSASWWRARLDRDSLAASLSWLLLVEAPWSLLRFHAEQDRAEVLEETWEDAWQAHGLAPGKGLDQGFFDLQEQPAPKPRVPLLLFSGTSVESGCRFNASMLQSSGRQRSEPSAGCLSPQGLEASPEAVLAATVDLTDFVCPGQQPRLSTAVLISARFPVISPSGHLRQPKCPGDPGRPAGGAARKPPPPPETFVVDGGYLDNSAADTAVDLWSALAPLVARHNQDRAAPAFIVPVFIQIDNGYAEPAGPGTVPRKPQLVAPIFAANATRNARQADARQGAQVVFGKPFKIGEKTVGFGGETTRYVRFSLLAHPGARAPTGWTLSDTSFEDLIAQFRRSNPEGNANTPLARVRRWFTTAQLS